MGYWKYAFPKQTDDGTISILNRFVAWTSIIPKGNSHF